MLLFEIYYQLPCDSMHNTVQHLQSQSVCLSVCLSVMTQYSVKMAQPTIKILSATDSPNILVFCD